MRKRWLRLAVTPEFMGVVGGGATTPITYLLRDEFTTDAAAPLTSPRTCEPGPGTLTIVDTTSKLSIASQILTFGGQNAAGDPGVWGQAHTNAIGLGFLWKMMASDNAATYPQGGWDTNQSSTSLLLIRHRPQNQDIYTTMGAIDFSETGFARATMHDFAIILRGTGGAFFLAKPNGGSWRLLWVNTTNYLTYVYPYVILGAFASGSASVDKMLTTTLLAPWNSANGIANVVVASSGVNGTSTMSANGIVEGTWTAVTGATFDLQIRRTDDDNCWIVRLDQANSKMYLYQKEAGTETERGATGGKAVTLTNGTAYRVWAKCYGNIINCGVNEAQYTIYNSATFNNTATGVKNTLAVSNLISWPWLIGGAALSVLNSVTG